MSDTVSTPPPGRPALRLAEAPPPGFSELAAAMAVSGVCRPGWSCEESAAAVMAAMTQLEAAGWPEPGQPVEYRLGPEGVDRAGTFEGLGEAGFTARVTPAGLDSSVSVPLAQVRPGRRRAVSPR